MPGNKLKSITPGRRNAYEKMKASGLSKSSAARIANAGKTASGRKAMARRAAATRASRKSQRSAAGRKGGRARARKR